jgi:hypothetical protein
MPGASPRRPRCRECSPIAAGSWIEAQAPGTAKGWRWQGSWDGLYAMIIEERVVRNLWRSDGVP